MGLFRDHYCRGDKQEISDFKSIWGYPSEFLFFFVKSILEAKSYKVLVINNKSLITCALVTLEARLELTISVVF